MRHRPIARAVTAAALLLLGGLSAIRLPLGYAPRVAFPELFVTLRLSTTTDPDDVARRWTLPLESAIRGLGGVAEMAGQVSSDGAWLRVRFAPGARVERKAARLRSELAGLRRALPQDSRIDVRERGGGPAEAATIVLDGPDAQLAWARVARELRATGGVHAVRPEGGIDRAERLLLRAGGPDDAAVGRSVETAIRAGLSELSLGDHRRGTRSLPVRSRTVSASEIERLPVRLGDGLLPLVNLGVAVPAALESDVAWRVDGQPSILLAVEAQPGVSLLGFDSELRRRCAELTSEAGGRHRLRVLESDAQPLVNLLRHLAIGALLGSAAAFFVGLRLAGGWGGAQLLAGLPTAAGAALTACWLGGVELDALTLPALALGVMSALPPAFLRLTPLERRALPVTLVTLAALALVPVAVSLSGGELPLLLAAPGRALLLSGLGALAASFLVAPPVGGGPLRSKLAGRALRGLMRDAFTTLLVVATAIHVLFTSFGSSLDPRQGRRSLSAGRLAVELRLGDGLSPHRVMQIVREAEDRLQDLPEVEWIRTRVTRGKATMTVELVERLRRADRTTLPTTRIWYALASLPAVLQVSDSTHGDQEGLTFDTSLESRSFTDVDARSYAVVIRAMDLESLRRATAEFWRVKFQYSPRPDRPIAVRSDFHSRKKVELSPRPETSASSVDSLVAELGAVARVPRAFSVGTGEEDRLAIVPSTAPRTRDDVPRRDALMDRPLPGSLQVPSAALSRAQRFVVPSVRRQSGRFVLPLTCFFMSQGEDFRVELRERLDSGLASIELPPGCELERPPLDPNDWNLGRVRLLGLALAVPLLLAALAGFALSSLRFAVAALVPPALGLATATPVLRHAGGSVDELGLFALAAASALTLASSSALLLGVTRNVGTPAPAAWRVYRSARPLLGALAGGGIVAAFVLVGASLGAEMGREPWVLPLRLAGLAIGVGSVGTTLVLPALALVILRRERGDAAAARELAHPRAWREPEGPPSLSARSLTKVYRGGVTGLADVSFELGPGIVGLLGPNGAGKTTCLRLLTGLLEPTRGGVSWRGVPRVTGNMEHYRRQVGFLPQEFNAYPGLTAVQFLDYWAIERGIDSARTRREEIDRLLVEVGLEEDADRKVREFSGGMRQRMGIARALLGSPPVLIVDEPTTGLDIESRNRFRELLLATAGERIVILSTHLAGDVEAAASRVLLLHAGRLRFDGPPAELVERARGRVFQTLVSDAELREFSLQHRVTARVRVLDGIRVRAVAAPDEDIGGGEVVEPSLEEAYLVEVNRAAGPRGASRGGRFAFLRDGVGRGRR